MKWVRGSFRVIKTPIFVSEKLVKKNTSHKLPTNSPACSSTISSAHPMHPIISQPIDQGWLRGAIIVAAPMMTTDQSCDCPPSSLWRQTIITVVVGSASS